jgi:hypothetical protein
MVGGPGKISDDKRIAEAYFNPLAGNPTIKLVLSAEHLCELCFTQRLDSELAGGARE